MPDTLARLPEVTELHTFVIAADERSIRRAARRLRLSPAGTGKRLDNLEAVVGHRLLVRGPRGLSLTPAGAELYPRAVSIVAEAKKLVGDPGLADGLDADGSSDAGLARLAEDLLVDAERLLARIVRTAGEESAA